MSCFFVPEGAAFLELLGGVLLRGQKSNFDR